MRRSSWHGAVSLLVFSMAASPALAGGDVNVFLGNRSSSDGAIDSAGLDNVPQYGVVVSLDFEWPVALAVDLALTSDDATVTFPGTFPTMFDTSVDTTELDVGVRKFWGKKGRPYVGGGIAWIELDATQYESGFLGPMLPFTDLVVSDSDSGIGFWLNAGYVYRFGDHVNVGVDLRYSDADVDLVPESAERVTLDAGASQIGFLIGYHW